MSLLQHTIEGIGMTSQRTRIRLSERLREKGIGDERALAAITRVPRHLFVDEALASRAYEDTALPIGHGQTISQPYMVAQMTQRILTVSNLGKVLEVGTGSGYQAAILSQLVASVFTTERIGALWRRSDKLLCDLGYHNIRTRHADGEWGWPEKAPFDAIVVTAAPEEVPQALLEQLAIGGKLLIPVGQQGGDQALLELTRQADGFTEEVVDRVSFVPFLSGRVAR